MLWTPMSYFYRWGGGDGAIRLSVSYLTPPQIDEGIDRLASFIRAEGGSRRGGSMTVHALRGATQVAANDRDLLIDAGAYLGARLSRLSRWEALALGAGVNARGVVEVVVASVGLRPGIINTA